MILSELQKLPHKWWKKNVDYIPSNKDVPITMEPFVATVVLDKKETFNNLKALNELTLYSDINPTIYDWYYAINTELLEYVESNSDFELADICIFCALTLKYFYQIDLMKYFVGTSNQIITSIIKPLVFNSDEDLLRLLDIFLWSLSSPKIIKKIEHNKRRLDHVYSRH